VFEKKRIFSGYLIPKGMYLQEDGTKMAWVKKSHGKRGVLAVAVGK
jgi:hypothetical protein